MELTLNIGYNQVRNLVRQLPEKEVERLISEVSQKPNGENETSDLEAFLLTAPTFTKKQIDEIEETRKAINQ